MPVVVEVPEAVTPDASGGDAPALSPADSLPAVAVAPEPRAFPRRLIVAFIFTAIGGLLVGGVAVWMWTSDSDLGDSKLRYPRGAVVEVVRPDNVPTGDTGSPWGGGMSGGRSGGGGGAVGDAVWQREIASHAAAIGHRSVLLRSLKNPEVTATAWHKRFDSTDLAAVSLARSLRVRTVPETALIEVFVDTGSPREQVILTQAVVMQYLEYQRQRRTLMFLDRTQMLNTARIKIESRMRDVEQEIQELVRSVAAYRHRTSSAAAATKSTTARPADQQELAERQEMAWEEVKLARRRGEYQHLLEQQRDLKGRIEELMALSSSTGAGELRLVNMPSDK